jgi:heat shock protein HslJ
VKPQDLDDHAPIEPDDKLLASVHSRSRSFRRHRTTQRLTNVTAGVLVLALAGGIAWTRIDTGDHRRLTLPAATSTTTGAMPISQTTVMGKWRPISIAGYHGQLTTPSISFDGRGRWRAFDGCNYYFGGTYSLHGDELLLGGTSSVTQKGCVRYHSTDSDPINPDFGPIIAAARIELRDDQLTFLTSDGKEIARFVRAGVTARIELPSTTMNAGSKMTAHVVVENDTGHEVRATGCGGLFGVGLRNAKIPQDVIFPSCAQDFTIPVGESSYPVQVLAEYYACDAAGDQGLQRCLANGGAPPLPPGIYQATLFQASPVVPAPPPIDVNVVP